MVQPIIVEEETVRKILTPEVLIPLMEEALRGCAQGTVLQPARTIHTFPEGKLFGFMPAYLGDNDYFGAKIVTAVPANAGTEYPSHLGSVLVFDSQHGVLRGMVDATSVTELRTSAVSAAATKALAREDAHVLALIGCGAQARGHIRCLTQVRQIDEIRLYARRPEHVEQLKGEVEARYGIRTVACTSVREAVEPADIICTLTPSKEPLLEWEWVRPGTHINAVGTFSPTTREVSSQLVAHSRLYADEVAAMKRESGEYLIPLQEGLITESHIVGSIGDVLLGRAPGRGSAQEVTLFDSLGLACEDIAAAKCVYQAVSGTT